MDGWMDGLPSGKITLKFCPFDIGSSSSNNTYPNISSLICKTLDFHISASMPSNFDSIAFINSFFVLPAKTTFFVDSSLLLIITDTFTLEFAISEEICDKMSNTHMYSMIQNKVHYMA